MLRWAREGQVSCDGQGRQGEAGNLRAASWRKSPGQYELEMKQGRMMVEVLQGDLSFNKLTPTFSTELETQSDWRRRGGMPRPSEVILISQVLATV